MVYIHLQRQMILYATAGRVNESVQRRVIWLSTDVILRNTVVLILSHTSQSAPEWHIGHVLYSQFNIQTCSDSLFHSQANTLPFKPVWPVWLRGGLVKLEGRWMAPQNVSNKKILNHNYVHPKWLLKSDGCNLSYMEAPWEMYVKSFWKQMYYGDTFTVLQDSDLVQQ